MCSAEGKNGFDTEIKLGIVTRHCLTGPRDEREETEAEMNGGKRNTGRERDIFSGAVRGGDIMEHNWEGVCVSAAEGKGGGFTKQGVCVCVGTDPQKSCTINERDNSAITHTHTHSRQCHLKSQPSHVLKLVHSFSRMFLGFFLLIY